MITNGLIGNHAHLEKFTDPDRKLARDAKRTYRVSKYGFVTQAMRDKSHKDLRVAHTVIVGDLALSVPNPPKKK